MYQQQVESIMKLRVNFKYYWMWKKNMNPEFVVVSLDLLGCISPCHLLSHFKTSMDDIFESSYVELKQ